MKPDRIKVSAEFPGLWLAAEVPIASDENEIEEFKKTRKLLIEAYKEMIEPKFVNVSEVLEGVVPVQQVEKLEPIDKRKILIGIEAATCLREPDGSGGLMQYQYISRTDKEIKTLFDKRLKELS